MVIAIIGILAGLLLPAVSQMKGKAKLQIAAKEIAELAGAIHAMQHQPFLLFRDNAGGK